MVVSALVASCCEALEAVQIQLTLEAGVLLLPEPTERKGGGEDEKGKKDGQMIHSNRFDNDLPKNKK